MEPGQRMDMPVVFFVSPDALDDPNMANVNEITLSYTFFPDKDASHPSSRSEGRNAASL